MWFIILNTAKGITIEKSLGITALYVLEIRAPVDEWHPGN